MYEKDLNSVTFIGADGEEHTLQVGDTINILIPHYAGEIQTVSRITCWPDRTHIRFKTQGGFAERADSWGRVWVLDGEEFLYPEDLEDDELEGWGDDLN